MRTETVTLFFALLTVASQVAVVGLAGLAVGARVSARASDLWAETRAVLAPHALGLALLVASVATAGSLWLSEGANFPPCVLCWYQRIGMYPLVPILGLAVVRRDAAVKPYGLALCAAALPISAYHYLLERFPTLEAGACDPDNPCSLVWVWHFGYISIPLMAGTAFALIGALLLVARPEAE